MYNNHPIAILATPYMAGIARRVQAFIPSSIASEVIPVIVKSFPNGAPDVQISANIRNRDVFIFHSTIHPDLNTGLITGANVIKAAIGASAANIYAVYPYLELRQDRKDRPRTAITARQTIDLIEQVERISTITFDMHGKQLQAAFRNPVDDLPGFLTYAPLLKKLYGTRLRDVVIIAPDGSAYYRAEALRDELGIEEDIGMMQKTRDPTTGKITMSKYVGPNLEGKIALSVDDIIGTARTQAKMAEILWPLKPREIIAAATHGLMSVGKDGIRAEELLRAAKIRVIISNTIPKPPEYYEENQDIIIVAPIEEILANTIVRSVTGQSVSQMWTHLADPKIDLESFGFNWR